MIDQIKMIELFERNRPVQPMFWIVQEDGTLRTDIPQGLAQARFDLAKTRIPLWVRDTSQENLEKQFKRKVTPETFWAEERVLQRQYTQMKLFWDWHPTKTEESDHRPTVVTTPPLGEHEQFWSAESSDETLAEFLARNLSDYDEITKNLRNHRKG